MSSPRHRAREIALQILYNYDVKSQAPGADLAAELKSHFDHFAVAEQVREFAAKLVSGTLAELSNIDQHLEKHATNWKIGRMSFIDRSLLRMTVYELFNFPDTPPSVVINEAVELAKQFGTSDSPAFVNGVLDSIRLAQSRKP